LETDTDCTGIDEADRETPRLRWASAVAKKENSSQQSKRLAVDRQLLVHCQGCEPDIDSVEKSNNVEKKDKWDNSDPQLAERSRLGYGRSNSCGRILACSLGDSHSQQRDREERTRAPAQGWPIVAPSRRKKAGREKSLVSGRQPEKWVPMLRSWKPELF